MFRVMRTARWRALETQLRDLQDLKLELIGETLRLRAEKALVQQARERADADAIYWRERAERFIDQVALKERIIAAPTMTEPASAATSPVDSLFSALGRSEINTSRTPPPAATPAVLGVDETAARAAIAEALEPR